MNLALYLPVDFLHLNIGLCVAINQVLTEPSLLVLHVEDTGVVYPAVILAHGRVPPSELLNGLQGGDQLLGVQRCSGAQAAVEGDS